MIIKVKVFLIVCVLQNLISGVQLKAPQINPATKSIVVDAGNKLSLGCSSESPTTWTIVNYKTIQYNYSAIVQNDKEGTILRLPNVTISNTGHYYCHESAANRTDYNRSSSIYIYVTDNKRLSVVPTNELSIIILDQNSTPTLPCLGTSPNIHVTLKNAFDFEVSPYQSPYIPGYGFKINTTHDQIYRCIFSINHQTEVLSMYIYYSSFIIINPGRTTTLIQGPNDQVAHVGKKLELVCSVIVPSKINVNVHLRWSHNKHFLNNTNRILIREDSSIATTNGRLLTGTLTIYELTPEDEGAYDCSVFEYSQQKLYSSTYYIKVTDSTLTLQEPKINSTNNEFNLTVHSNFTIECSAEESINWYLPNKMENTKIRLMFDELKSIYKAVLKITDVSVENVGFFYCKPEHVKFNNKFRSKEVYIYVKGNDKAALAKHIGSSEPIHGVLNSFVTIPCIPASRDVNVTLLDSSNTQVESLIRRKSVKHGFEVIMKSPGLHYYICLYQKDSLEVKQNVPVAVIADPYHDIVPTIEATSNGFLYVEDDLILSCSIILYDYQLFEYTDLSLKWNLSQQSALKSKRVTMEEIKFYAVPEGKVVNKRLIIKKVNLSDAGNYTCTSYGNSTTKSLLKEITVVERFSVHSTIEGPTGDIGIIGEDMTLICTAKVDHNDNVHFKWTYYDRPLYAYWKYQFNSSSVDKISGVINKSTLTIRNLTDHDEGEYKCIICNNLNCALPLPKHIYIRETRISMRTNKAPAVLSSQEGQKVNLYCNDDVNPLSMIYWTKNNRILRNQVNDSRIKFWDNNTGITISHSQKEDEGYYVCHVKDNKGTTEFTTKLVIRSDGKEWSTSQIITYIIPVILVVIVFVALAVRIFQEKKRRQELEAEGLLNFEQGAVDNINPNLGVDSQVVLLPYYKTFEIPRNKIKLGKQLGSGFFGIVVQAEIAGYFKGETVKTVAVKMLKPEADFNSIRAFLLELKIMANLGKHVNIVNLLGACTKNIPKRELRIIVEYCQFGNIRNYLLKQRNNFINTIDPTTGIIEPYTADENELQIQLENNNKIIYSNIAVSESDGYLQPLNIQCNFMDANERITSTSTHDLLCWSFQIARGMEYLSSRNVLHGDLAARNILLTENYVVKICDFGLAKNMYKNSVYKKKSEGPLPVKWLALESITDGIFSTQSDVWSFGIVLWELFSLAKSPYPELDVDEHFFNKLKEGYRMAQPQYATNQMYQIMLDCWKFKPSERPSFSRLVQNIDNMLEHSVTKYYIELNEPYMNTNKERFAKQCDYLALMMKPDYNNLASQPHIYVNVNTSDPNES